MSFLEINDRQHDQCALLDKDTYMLVAHPDILPEILCIHGARSPRTCTGCPRYDIEGGN